MLAFLAALVLQPAPSPPPHPAVTAAPDPAAEAGVRAATEAWLSARDAGRFDASWAMMSPAGQARRPRDQWLAAITGFRETAGAARGHRVTAVTWLENPGGVAGVYGAVEYDADYADLVFMCGVLLWHRQPDGRWLLFREVTHGAARADAPNATPEQIAEGRRQSNCRD